MDINIIGKIAFGLSLVFFAVALTDYWVEKRKKKKGFLSPFPSDNAMVREEVDHPVIGYKTANIERIQLDEQSSITDVVFRGLVGSTYGVLDTTEETGHRKFNMFADMSAALNHEQQWGSVLLEAVGYGNVEAHELGYTSQNQRALQLAFLECSYFYAGQIKCKNSPAYLGVIEGDSEKRFRAYCAGCVEKTSVSHPLELFLNRSYELSDGNTLVVGGKSTRKQVNIVPTPGAETASTEEVEDGDV